MLYHHNESCRRKRRACFTGHRPWKTSISEYTLRSVLKKAILQAICNGYTTFISGMAQGYDIIAAELVLEQKKENPDIRLICALPHPTFSSTWDKHWTNRLECVLTQADLVRVISPSYSSRCYQLRNEWMVNHAALVIAFYHGIPSGTKNTIDYARLQGLPVYVLQFEEY